MTYYFGSAVTELPNGGSLRVSSSHALTYGIEAGYGVTLLDVLTIRPQLGIGNATFVNPVGGREAAPAVQAGSTSDLYVEPGVVALLSFHRWFVGIDASLFFVPGMNDDYGHDWKTAFALDGQFGIRF